MSYIDYHELFSTNIQTINTGIRRSCEKGYLNSPEVTAKCIDVDDFFHTGDVVVINSEGHIFIGERINELIKYKGFQVQYHFGCSLYFFFNYYCY